MRIHPDQFQKSLDDMDRRAVNVIGRNFINEVSDRLDDIRDSIEDIWDLASNKQALFERLQAKASKSAADITKTDLIDIALLSMFLWNSDD